MVDRIGKFLNTCTLLVKSCDVRVKFASDKKAVYALAVLSGDQ